MSEVRVLDRKIVWLKDEDASKYQRPCKGCPRYCELAQSDDVETQMLSEVYQQEYCAGRTLVRMTTRWQVMVEHRTGPHHNPLVVTGLGNTSEEAELDAMTLLARSLLCSAPEIEQ